MALTNLINRAVWRITPDAFKKDMMEYVLNEVRESTVSQMLSEPGWAQLSAAGVYGLEDNEIVRQDALAASRYYWHRDPLYKRAITLVRNYTFGRGVSWNATDDDVKAIIQEFWDDPDNRRTLSRATAQWELSERIQAHGELFPVFFVNRFNGHVKTSIVEPEEIGEIVTDPNDRRKPIYYCRDHTQRRFDWNAGGYTGVATKRDYYPDWEAPATQAEQQRQPGDDPLGVMHATVWSKRTAVYMHQWKVNSHGKRGVPAYFAVLPWVKVTKGFLEDRATITLAAATYAFKQKIKGGANALVRAVSTWGSKVFDRYTGTGAGSRERPEGGRTFVENEASDLQQMQFDTRSGAAYQDARIFRQMIAAGTDITEPDLTGDPSVGNLASMTAMNGPQLKGFESWQQYFKDFYTDVFDFVIRMAIIHKRLGPNDAQGNKRDLTVEVDFPPIVTNDLPQFMGAIASLITAQTSAGQRYISDRRLATYILQAFGENDVELALEELGLDEMPEIEHLPDSVADTIERALEVMERESQRVLA